LYQSSEQAGLKIGSIEPALSAIGRAVGRLGGDSDEASLLIYLTDKAVEIGVFQKGRLLLEYRPGICETTKELVQTIETHRGRLQRHVARLLKDGQQKLNKIYLIGGEAEVQTTLTALSANPALDVSLVSPDQVRATWEYQGAGDLAGSAAIPVLGGLLGSLNPEQSDAPNFMDHITAVTREPIKPILIKSLVPIAAVLLIAMGMWTVSLRQKLQNDAQRTQIEALAETLTRARELALKQAANKSKLLQIEQLAAQIHVPNMAEVIGNVAKCMPSDVWLRSLSVTSSKSLSLRGSSFLEAGVFDFVKWLELAPGIEDVALRSTKSARTEIGLAVEFDVDVNFADPKLPTAEVASNE
jgi:hypothetical protein